MLHEELCYLLVMNHMLINHSVGVAVNVMVVEVKLHLSTLRSMPQSDCLGSRWSMAETETSHRATNSV